MIFQFCFNFLLAIQKALLFPLNGCVEPSKRQFWQIPQHPKFTYKKGTGQFGYYKLVCPGSLTPINPCFQRSTEISKLYWCCSFRHRRENYWPPPRIPMWKSCTYNSRTDYIILGAETIRHKTGAIQTRVKIQNLSMAIPLNLVIGKIIPSHGHWQPTDGTMSICSPMLSYTAKGKTWWQPEIWSPCCHLSCPTIPGQKTTLPILYLPAYPPLFYAPTWLQKASYTDELLRRTEYSLL